MHRYRRKGAQAGFTLTEMLVTLLILTLAATLLATGVPVAIDTYQKTVRTADAQLALSTTITVLRAELESAPQVEVTGSGASAQVRYESDEGTWAAIRNFDSTSGETYQGLVKEYLAGQPTDPTDPSSVEALPRLTDIDPYPLISDAMVTEPLRVGYEEVTYVAATPVSPAMLEFTNLCVYDVDNSGAPRNVLAAVGNDGEPFCMLLRFEQ